MRALIAELCSMQAVSSKSVQGFLSWALVLSISTGAIQKVIGHVSSAINHAAQV
jgi:hypothetical protein